MSAKQIYWFKTEDVSQNEVLSWAARELSHYVKRLCDQDWSVHPQSEFSAQENTIWLTVCNQLNNVPAECALTPAPWDDGFAIWQQDGALHISGRNSRSVLYGVYAFLETQGVRFCFPRLNGEVVPARVEIDFPNVPLVEHAKYRHRGVCIEGATSLEHALGMIEWCAKKRMNTVFLQFLSSRYFYNQWYERRYNPDFYQCTLTEEEALSNDEQLIMAMKKRGMVFHRVGHGWTGAAVGLPRSGWVQADEDVDPQYERWLAEVDGERKLFGNIPINTELCYSHPPAFEAFIETIIRYCEMHPELDVVHVWLSDATNNKCECAECRKLSISDWYVKIINALSKALNERVPQMRFVFLCYIELLWPPEQLQIDEQARGNTIMMFAPISRCYGHALHDPDCDDGQPWPRPPFNQFGASRHNAFYTRVLSEWRQSFAGDSFDYDYHLMWAIWAQMTDTYVARIFHQDLQKLQALGLNGIVSCQSFRAFYPSGLAMTALAECLWNPDVSWSDLRSQYIQATYGSHAEWADVYLARVESWLDTGDPHLRTPPLSNAGETELAKAAAFLQASLAQVTKLLCHDLNAVHRRALELLAHHARMMSLVVALYQAHLADDETSREKIRDRVVEFMRKTEAQYSHHIDTMLSLRVLERIARD